MDHVFISYAGKDRALAAKLNRALVDRNVTTRSALNIPADGDWHAYLVEALQQSAVVIVVVTPRSLESGWVEGEWANALERSLRVIPVLANGMTVTGLPAGRRNAGAISLDDDGLEHAADRIVAAIAGLDRSDARRPSRVVDVDSTADDAAAQELLGRGVEPIRHPVRPDERSGTVFVITSFKDDMSDVMEVIRAAASGVGLLAFRADDQLGDDRLHDAILYGIETSTLVVADLTHERPNVYFELGYARGQGRSVTTIAREGTELHFNVRDYRCIWYSESAGKLEWALDRAFRHELIRRARTTEKGRDPNPSDRS